MRLKISWYWTPIFVVASFAVGMVVSPYLTPITQPINLESTTDEGVEKFNKIDQEIKKLSNELNQFKNSNTTISVSEETVEEISNLQEWVENIDLRIDRLSSLSQDISELRNEIASLQVSPESQSLTASLDRSQYRVGDSLIVNGVGMPNRSVGISLLDSNTAVSEGSTMTDSSGKFAFTMQLSNLSDGDNYVIKVIQEGKVVEKPFTLSPKSQSLTASLDRSQYRVGDSLIVNGVGMPNRSVGISLLDSNTAVSEGSTMTDSSGKFAFTMQLSNLSDGDNYVIKVIQEGKVVEKPFTLSPRLIQTGDFILETDNVEYEKGEKVLLSGITDPNVWIDLDIYDSNNVQIIRTSTLSDGSGRYSLEYTISSTAVVGDYLANASVNDKQVSVKFAIVLTSTSSSSSSSSNLTIETDRSIYNRGDFVIVTGKGSPNGKVTILVEPQTGDDILLGVNTDGSGNYRTIFATKQDAFRGEWEITVKQGLDRTTINITLV